MQRAQWVGQHMLPLFFSVLVVLLAATFMGWWLFRRCRKPDHPRTTVPMPFVGHQIAVGFMVFTISVGIFAGLASQLSATGALAQADLALTDALRTSVPLLAVQGFSVLTHFADTATLSALCIAVALVLVAVHQHVLAFGWVVAVAGNGLLNNTLKQVFGRIRPLRPDGVVFEPGFSFPSGHSSGGVVAYGMLAYLALRLLPGRWHLPALSAAVVLAFTIGASRLFMRVHFASDVIAGFASGSAWLAVCVSTMALLQRRRLQTA